ncbi:Metal-dependent hydrolase, endonuclease/exonuclease/phosphatase family [Salinihabitans flavidus]|uniref:Metal-dependent hydrolase, endonuclease/exonuclease/phosphatase family n=2 Tax=Salinihabitans flavidus TaxID=569882 RepID=A0A1H8PW40_9RHOB|nr:Metal-dependent hydrolase, endonuclease/exonuclease/phosphatase family [Salinihabitans flavidus]
MRRRPDRTLQVLADLGAQVAVLQEADKRRAPRPAALPHAMAEHEGWRVLPFGQPGGSLGWHGNAMLVRPEVTALETAHIELPGLEPRGAIRADLLTPIGPLRVIGLHLGLIRRYRILQLNALAHALQGLPPLPTVIAGDFNEWGRTAPLEAALRGLRLLSARASFPAARPVAALDRIALGPGLLAHAHDSHGARPAHIASDHLPVWADIAQDG